MSFATGETTASVLEGLTIRNSTGTLVFGESNGGGICYFPLSPRLSGNIIIGYSATRLQRTADEREPGGWK